MITFQIKRIYLQGSFYKSRIRRIESRYKNAVASRFIPSVLNTYRSENSLKVFKTIAMKNIKKIADIWIYI